MEVVMLLVVACRDFMESQGLWVCVHVVGYGEGCASGDFEGDTSDIC